VSLVIYLPLVLPLLAAATARPLAGRLPPAAASWLLAGSALALAAASSAVLGLLALTALLRIPLAAAAAGDMSVQVLSRDAPASLPIAVAAGALLAASVTAAGRALWRRAGALAAAFGQARRLPGAAQVVVTDDEAADAYTLPGWPCRIVVTAGMMRALTDAERQVLLAHERTHAAWFHYLFTSAARVAAAANPLLRPVASAVGYTVERWADERAAAVTGNRPLAARAVARAAMAATAAGQTRRPIAAVALGMVGGMVGRNRPGPVPRRVAALLNPPPRPQLLLLALAVLLVAVSGFSALEASRDLHALLELAQASGR
jgi:Zn-dependent protease with chaperone function